MQRWLDLRSKTKTWNLRRIETTAAEGMAAEDSSQATQTAANGAMFLDRANHVLAAGGLKPAAWSEQG